ncbi:MAG TPA: copper resistance protein CopC, partial [Acidimicrobiales bacterium]|nr:copper resistance protein CopC [Acidimicrobiales bacterium]
MRNRWRSRRVWWFLAAFPVAVGVAVGALAGAPPASAHALAVSSTPPAGATLAEAPATVTIVFSESPDPSLSTIQVLDSAGNPHQAGRSATAVGQPNSLQVQVGSLGPGVYTVSWRTVSRVDGHLASGSFAFGVKVTPAGAGASSAVVRAPPASTWAVAARWTFYVGVMGLVGVTVVGLLAGAHRSQRRLRWLGLAGWLLAAGGGVALEEQQRRSDGIPLGKLLNSSLGHQVLWRGIPLIAALVGVIWIVARPSSTVGIAVVGASAVAAMFGDVEASHVSGERSWRWFHLLTQWAHFASAGIWVGGLAVLLGVIGTIDARDRRTLIKRFSNVALVSVVAIAITGVLRGLDEIRSWHGLFDTTFGKWAILKVSLLILLGALGLLQRTRGVPKVGRGSPRFLRQIGTTELAVAAVVLVAAGFLQSLAPPSATSSLKASKAVVVSGSDFATTVRVRLEVSPGTPGFNRFTLRAVDYDTLRPVTAQSVNLTFGLPARPDLGTSTLDLSRRSDGDYSAVAPNLSVSGIWAVTILIQRGSQSAEVPLTFTTRTVPLRIDVSRSPGLPTVYTIHVTPTADIQVYLDPGKPGFNEFHVTVLSSGGNEIPTSALAVHAAKSGQVA